MRAVVLLSGGLDSLLAARVVGDQGIELEALNFVTLFCNCTPKSRCCSSAASAVRQLGIPLRVVNNSADFIEIVKHPRHGYGRNMNPCLDCRILMFRKAAERMRETGAAFIVTGEVLGERPMSQRHEAMRLIEREAGLEGLIVRPLSAACLEPSLPEKQGWLDRSRLLAIRGRSRKPQIELAKQYDLRDYPCPAGGCLLTDPEFAARMRDLLAHQPDFTLHDALLLKVGRHYRLGPATKAVVGRDEPENERLLALAAGDARLELADMPGPLTLLRGGERPEHSLIAARLTAAHSKARDRREVRVLVRSVVRDEPETLTVAPAEAEMIAALRVGS